MSFKEIDETLYLNEDMYKAARMEMLKANAILDQYVLDQYYFDDKDPEEILRIYKNNSFGYRCDELKENRDFVFSGCSFTYGQGIQKEGVWGVQVANKLGLDYYNLGIGGLSTIAIVDNLFNYFRIYGNPKILMCLFPDFLRQPVAYNVDEFEYVENPLDDNSVKRATLYLEKQDMPKYAKKPYPIQDIFPKEYTFDQSIKMIKMLEIYCYYNNIKFLWSTWKVPQHEIIKNSIQKFNNFKNFVQLDVDQWHTHPKEGYLDRFGINFKNNCKNNELCVSYVYCHEDLRSLYGKTFDLPFDRNAQRGSFGHCGVHQHIHFAESFINALEVYDERNLL